MPVGGAILGASVIGGGVALSASAKAAKAAKSAATTNNALLQAAQDRAYKAVDPYIQPGYDATNTLSKIVNGGGYAAAANAGSTGSSGAAAGGTDWNAYLQQNPDAAEWVQGKIAGGSNMTPQMLAEQHYQLDGQARGEFRALPTVAAAAPSTAVPTTPAANPTYGPTVAPRTTTARPTAAPLDISTGSYEKSPDYEYQLSEGNRNILAQKAALGQLESGDAMKSLQKYGQDLALGDYSQWRGFTTQQYNTDRDFANTNYDIDESRSDARYDADRGYLTSRFDQQVNDLFKLSGQGLGAVGTAVNVGQNTANSQSANNNSAASATGNSAIAGANNVNALLGTALQAYGAFKTPTAGATTPINYTSPTYNSTSGSTYKINL